MGEGRTCAENNRHCRRREKVKLPKKYDKCSVGLRDFDACGPLSYNIARGVLCGVVKFTSPGEVELRKHGLRFSPTAVSRNGSHAATGRGGGQGLHRAPVHLSVIWEIVYLYLLFRLWRRF